MYTTQKYRDFQLSQVEELLTNYGKIMEMWIDIPGTLGQEGKQIQYDQIAALQPDTVIMLNNGIGDGTELKYNYTWPTDLMAIERFLPDSRGHNPWFQIPVSKKESQMVYIPGEVCDPIGYEWFYEKDDQLRTDAELLGIRLITESRGANLLLDVPPDTRGLIPEETVAALMRLEENYARQTIK
jgi:alpha-L-fucosidase